MTREHALADAVDLAAQLGEAQRAPIEQRDDQQRPLVGDAVEDLADLAVLARVPLEASCSTVPVPGSDRVPSKCRLPSPGMVTHHGGHLQEGTDRPSRVTRDGAHCHRPPRTAAHGRPHAGRCCSCSAAPIFLEGIDVAMLNVALPSIRDDLGLSTAMLHWVVSAYVLGYGGFMLLGGRAADLLGRRRHVPRAGSRCSWCSRAWAGSPPRGGCCSLARFVTGVAAAFMTPAGLSLVTTSFAEGPARNRALLVYAATGAAGFTLGLVARRAADAVHWRWVFFAPVVLSAPILLAVATRLIPDGPAAAAARGGFDLAGALDADGRHAAAGVYGVVRAPGPALARHGRRARRRARAAGRVRRDRAAAPAPLVRLGHPALRPAARANVRALLFAGSFFGFQFLVTLYLQEVRGWSTLETGLALLVVGIDAVLAPTVTPRLVERFGNPRVTLGGLALAAVATRCSCGWARTGPTPRCSRRCCCSAWRSRWPTGR